MHYQVFELTGFIKNTNIKRNDKMTFLVLYMVIIEFTMRVSNGKMIIKRFVLSVFLRIGDAPPSTPDSALRIDLCFEL